MEHRAHDIGRRAKGIEVVAWGEGVEVRKAEGSKLKGKSLRRFNGNNDNSDLNAPNDKTVKTN